MSEEEIIKIFEEAKKHPVTRVTEEDRVMGIDEDRCVFLTESFEDEKDGFKNELYITVTEVKGICDAYAIAILDNLDFPGELDDCLGIFIEPFHPFYNKFNESFKDLDKLENSESFVAVVRCTVKRHLRKLMNNLENGANVDFEKAINFLMGKK